MIAIPGGMDRFRRWTRLAVLLSKDAADYERDGERFIRLAEFHYFDPTAMKAAAILSPNRDRDLTSIVVIATR